ncbi:unnamed protein product [Adineta steineri]|uniref:Uncharacterized protein n=1 Tax=Adineta steineri TaxID=433720 RepID=A0A818ZBB1_9BILA|nr:unnamed protein product [Adineta steineri]
MPVLHENNNDLESEDFDDDDDDEPSQGLVIRRTTSYSIRPDNKLSKSSNRETLETIGVNQAIACALKSHPKAFHYTQKQLQYLPSSIKYLIKCKNIRELDLHGNQLKSLPDEIENLKSVEICNLANNHFETIPAALGKLSRLTKLLLFNNHLGDLSTSLVFSKLSNLRILNLNNNFITQLPNDIGCLVNLEILTIEHNQLIELPREIGLCIRLIELHLGFNSLTKLPLEIGYLINLTKLIIHRNNLLEIPESITNLKNSLKILDIACNSLRIFPSQFYTLQLKEFHNEHNPLIERVPIHSVQENEILTLKEICARRSMYELCNSTENVQSNLRDYLQYNTKAKEILMQCTECQLCHNYFLNTWLECVEFIDAQQIFPNMKTNTTQTTTVIPQRVLLCSYKCFNNPDHNYFGVAFV